ncbi:MAG: riboflavin biosynthesis protein RibF [Candidatus Omnitrophica bacterium]|nr:riboflavin biosynthesis protein RibF [Candidatus Omnitrophota bacterium]
MRIITDLHRFQASPSKPLVLAIGNFDGFHRGHQTLLRYVVRQAKRRKAVAAALTFVEHPYSVLYPDRKPMMLTGVEQKMLFLARAGMDICFLQKFTPKFAAITPQDFVRDVLVRKLRIREVCMGYDARFGHDRKGDAGMMAHLAEGCGFHFKKMDPVLVAGQPVSSSRIRAHLLKGEVKKAGDCLGRPFSMFGKVVRGKGHGTHLGAPTANLEVHAEIVLPFGVYVASGRILPERVIAPRSGYFRPPSRMPSWLRGVMNFGKRPTYPSLESPRPVLELHLLDFKGDVYGTLMEIALHRFLRPEKKFGNEEALKRQIGRDILQAKRYYVTGR